MIFTWKHTKDDLWWNAPRERGKKRTIKIKYNSDGFFFTRGGDEDCPTWALIHTHIWFAGEEKPFPIFIAEILWNNKRIKTTNPRNPFFFHLFAIYRTTRVYWFPPRPYLKRKFPLMKRTDPLNIVRSTRHAGLVISSQEWIFKILQRDTLSVFLKVEYLKYFY